MICSDSSWRTPRSTQTKKLYPRYSRATLITGKVAPMHLRYPTMNHLQIRNHPAGAECNFQSTFGGAYPVQQDDSISIFTQRSAYASWVECYMFQLDFLVGEGPSCSKASQSIWILRVSGQRMVYLRSGFQLCLVNQQASNVCYCG